MPPRSPPPLHEASLGCVSHPIYKACLSVDSRGSEAGEHASPHLLLGPSFAACGTLARSNLHSSEEVSAGSLSPPFWGSLLLSDDSHHLQESAFITKCTMASKV